MLTHDNCNTKNSTARLEDRGKNVFCKVYLNRKELKSEREREKIRTLKISKVSKT